MATESFATEKSLHEENKGKVKIKNIRLVKIFFL